MPIFLRYQPKGTHPGGLPSNRQPSRHFLPFASLTGEGANDYRLRPSWELSWGWEKVADRPDEGPLCPLLQCQQYRIAHRISLGENLYVANTQHHPPLLFQKPRPPFVVANLALCLVRGSINFNNQLMRPAGKISKIWPNWQLTHKLEAIEPAATQLFP